VDDVACAKESTVLRWDHPQLRRRRRRASDRRADRSSRS